MSRHRPGAGGQLRIIGGHWRSRKLPVASVPGLRPTSDRLRETLFNWLQFNVPGAVCLDLFAGSGALGFEALSRGAAQVVMVEKNRNAYECLQANAGRLQAENLQIIHGDARDFLRNSTQAFDLIFLDPPFHKHWLDTVIPLLLEQELLKPQGRLYVEYEQDSPPDWSVYPLQCIKSNKAGQVGVDLLMAG